MAFVAFRAVDPGFASVPLFLPVSLSLPPSTRGFFLPADTYANLHLHYGEELQKGSIYLEKYARIVRHGGVGAPKDLRILNYKRDVLYIQVLYVQFRLKYAFF